MADHLFTYINELYEVTWLLASTCTYEQSLGTLVYSELWQVSVVYQGQGLLSIFTYSYAQIEHFKCIMNIGSSVPHSSGLGLLLFLFFVSIQH